MVMDGGGDGRSAAHDRALQLTHATQPAVGTGGLHLHVAGDFWVREDKERFLLDRVGDLDSDIGRLKDIASGFHDVAT